MHGGTTCLADVAGPGNLLLSGRGHQDDGVRLDVLGLHDDLEVQMLRVLACLLRLGWEFTIIHRGKTIRETGNLHPFNSLKQGPD